MIGRLRVEAQGGKLKARTRNWLNQNIFGVRKQFYILFVIILFSACTHRIVRTGYDVNKSDYKDCNTTIKRAGESTNIIGVKVGEIKLGQSVFAVANSEEHAINILKNESCALNADLVIITEEKRPDFSNFWYCCKAEFYGHDYLDAMILSDQTSKKKKVQGEKSNDFKKIELGSGNALGIILQLLFLGIL